MIGTSEVMCETEVHRNQVISLEPCVAGIIGHDARTLQRQTISCLPLCIGRSAMHFRHSNSAIHCDLRTETILLDRYWMVGMSKCAHELKRNVTVLSAPKAETPFPDLHLR
jgi:hypothetical protein